MLVPDVNVLLNATNEHSETHEVASSWLEMAANGTESLGVADLVLSSYVRIVTNPKLETLVRSANDAFAQCEEIRRMPAYVPLKESPTHWDIFRALVLESGVAGPHISDAYLAAFAVENNATFVTFDRGFHRFPGLKLQVLE